jgi:hypothetical protein
MKNIIYRSSKPLTQDQVQRFPHSRIENDWETKPVEAQASVALAVDPSSLHFSARVEGSAWHFEEARKGQFVDGLWQRDVAELFICDAKDPERYQEFNLSPQGAWWTCLFKAPRVPEAFAPIEPNYVHSSILENAWSAAISFKLDDLAVNPAFEDSARLNVCAILGQEPREYLSWSNLGGETPDFHKPEKFALCEIKPIVI